MCITVHLRQIILQSYEEVNEAKRKFDTISTANVNNVTARDDKEDSDYSTSERPTKRRRVEPIKGGTCRCAR